MYERNNKILAEFQNNTFKKLQEPTHIEYPGQVMFGLNENQIIDNVVIKIEDKLMAVGVTDNEQWLTNINPNMHTLIVFGMGLGYHVESLIQRYPDKKIIVIEPDIRIFNHAMQLKDFENIIRHTEIWVDESVDTVKGKIYEMITHPLARGIMVIPFYVGVYQDYFNSLVEWMKKAMNDWAVMVNTKRCLVDKWYTNRTKNDEVQSVNFSNFVDKFKDIPAILVGGGASLIEHIPLLKQLENKAIIFAAGTTIEILLNHGVTPTFMAAIDQDPISEGGLHEHLEEDIPLIFDGQVAQNSLYYKGKKIQMQLNVNRYTGMVMPNLPIIESAPSIGNVGLDILHKMGCSPILMVGMDFSYGYGKLYCDGTRFQEERKDTGQYIMIKNNFDETVPTEPSFLSMINWFEEYAPRIKPNVINCTHKGIVFKTIPWQPITDFTFDKEYDFNAMINDCYKEFIDVSKVKQIKLELKSELEKAKEFIEKNKTINPEFQKLKSWILIEEYTQTEIYLAEIRCEARIRDGMDKKESVKMFQDKRIELILNAINRLLKLLK
jgi:hypothetical protein